MRAQAFPTAWRGILDRYVPHYVLYEDIDRAELEARILVFIDEKSFEGCRGQVIDDEVRVAIAGNACVLTLGHAETDYYPNVQSVLVYPRAFVTRVRRELSGMTAVETDEVRIGEAWAHGSVILSWLDVRFDAPGMLPFENVVLHEFAHQLDEESGPSDGVPPLPSRELAGAWQEIMSAEYRALCEAEARQEPTFIDPYGVENPAEFFAVVTEHFFAEPHELWINHPELYEIFVDYYGQDPAALIELWEERQAPDSEPADAT